MTALCSRPTTPRANARQNMRSRISAIGRKEEKFAQKRTFSIGKRPFLPFYSDFTKADFLILQPAFMMATVARKKIHEKTKGSILNEV